MVAILLIALPLGSRTPAQQSSQATPPLRTLVREFDPVIMPEATAYSIFTTEGATPHQVWYRVSGGDALFRQRLRVYQENAEPRPINQLPPDSELKHEITTNAPTGWFLMPAETGIFTYYFDGDHRTTAGSPWENAFGLKVTRTRFSNGNLYELGFEDKETLDDYNDLELQVVILQPV
ncbi:MAG: hypothetical protein HC922_02395 [Leptolyngbyaceae cyanobacterium SM2_3_12]|nr:hypothetical protein [Leptolyngbyaceae cyanobacterium SM2_3_12]